MDSRKKYDHWGIEISIWNKTNVVTYIDCDCGQLARKEIGKYNQFKCSSCKKGFCCKVLNLLSNKVE
ncbi:hypothetical protein [Enterococcus faecalis]|uniref:hypothetical protein n=1 Tax=Enterococcus faecalis TaxID=1351 RepID=UPI00080C7D46|nr:hypothetical protein [Enterococcus faecalis]ANU72139.1 hypothetical protein A4V06_03330 [Enterococcus faecalis]ASU26834.1 hypothetical protein ADH73_12705 [Enterococcus faecalis]